MRLPKKLELWYTLYCVLVRIEKYIYQLKPLVKRKIQKEFKF